MHNIKILNMLKRLLVYSGLVFFLFFQVSPAVLAQDLDVTTEPASVSEIEAEGDTDAETDTGTDAESLKEAPIKPLTAIIESQDSVEVSKNIIFDGSKSINPNPSIGLLYEWDFGDGETGEGVEVVHSYTEPGRYTVSLTVRDELSFHKIEVEVFVYNKIMVLVTDNVEEEDTIAGLMTLAEQQGNYIKLIDSYSSASDFIAEEVLASKLVESYEIKLDEQAGDIDPDLQKPAGKMDIVCKLRKDVKLLALSGNMCADKKVTAVNPLLGKGKGVVAEVVIPRKVIEQVWKTTPEAMVKVNNVKNWVGSGLAGTITGFNANAANTVAAFYAATGQDLAHVGTSSTCYDYLEVVKDGLLFSITMPNVEVGSIGGGMYFGTAKECLAMIGCDDPSDEGSAKRVAEVLAAAVAAQEINLIGTLANMFELAESHVKLARGETEGTRTRGSEQKN